MVGGGKKKVGEGRENGWPKDLRERERGGDLVEKDPYFVWREAAKIKFYSSFTGSKHTRRPAAI
jgi:hypothetical protein